MKMKDSLCIGLLCSLILMNGIVSAAVDGDHHLETRFRRSHFRGSSSANSANSVSGVDKTGRAFLTANGTTIRAQRGGTALLPCSVRDSSQGMVSWIRCKDFQLLTVGASTHSTDDRFQVAYNRPSSIWPLKIKSVAPEDEGTYECQITTYPPSSIHVHLKVVEAAAEIQGAPDLYIRAGSALRLVCLIKGATEEPSYVFWYHSMKMINFETSSGYEVTSKKGASILTIPEAKRSVHTGNYTCEPSNARVASVSVHVLDGEQPAAMQHSNVNSADGVSSSTYVIVLVTLFFLYN